MPNLTYSAFVKDLARVRGAGEELILKSGVMDCMEKAFEGALSSYCYDSSSRNCHKLSRYNVKAEFKAFLSKDDEFYIDIKLESCDRDYDTGHSDIDVAVNGMGKLLGFTRLTTAPYDYSTKVQCLVRIPAENYKIFWQQAIHHFDSKECFVRKTYEELKKSLEPKCDIAEKHPNTTAISKFGIRKQESNKQVFPDLKDEGPSPLDVKNLHALLQVVYPCAKVSDEQAKKFFETGANEVYFVQEEPGSKLNTNKLFKQ